MDEGLGHVLVAFCRSLASLIYGELLQNVATNTIMRHFPISLRTAPGKGGLGRYWPSHVTI